VVRTAPKKNNSFPGLSVSSSMTVVIHRVIDINIRDPDVLMVCWLY